MSWTLLFFSCLGFLSTWKKVHAQTEDGSRNPLDMSQTGTRLVCLLSNTSIWSCSFPGFCPTFPFFFFSFFLLSLSRSLIKQTWIHCLGHPNRLRRRCYPRKQRLSPGLPWPRSHHDLSPYRRNLPHKHLHRVPSRLLRNDEPTNTRAVL